MSSDTTRRGALARNLCARLCNEQRSITELQVIDLLLDGIESHAPEYGAANVETDTRDLTDELDQELGDGLFYMLLRGVKRRAARLERLRCEAADELARTNPMEHALRELRDSKPVIRRPHPVLDFDLGGESG